MAGKRSYLEGYTDVLVEHHFSISLFFDHVGVDVLVHSCILAQLEQSRILFLDNLRYLCETRPKRSVQGGVTAGANFIEKSLELKSDSVGPL